MCEKAKVKVKAKEKEKFLLRQIKIERKKVKVRSIQKEKMRETERFSMKEGEKENPLRKNVIRRERNLTGLSMTTKFSRPTIA